jgi:predicted solute-binding protein
MTTVSEWRIGTVPFVNERPLTAALRDRDGIALTALPPGALAAALVEGRFDAALIPVAELLRHGLTPLAPFGIACRGDVRSVRLWHDAPRAGLTRITVPAYSRSSVMLLRVLCDTWGCAGAELVPGEFPPGMREPPAGPVLLIGDDALRCLGSGRPATDLGAAWLEATGLPFVFARWAARPGLPAAARDALTERLTDAATDGLADLPAVATRAAEESEFGDELVHDYLRHAIVYDIGAEEEAGYREFERRARLLGLL